MEDYNVIDWFDEGLPSRHRVIDPEPVRPAAQAKRRPCLKCRERFKSPGAHVRLCDRCRLANDHVSDPHADKIDHRPRRQDERTRAGPQSLTDAIATGPKGV